MMSQHVHHGVVGRLQLLPRLHFLPGPVSALEIQIRNNRSPSSQYDYNWKQNSEGNRNAFVRGFLNGSAKLHVIGHVNELSLARVGANLFLVINLVYSGSTG